MEYPVNKGIGANVEIWGLEAQYIFYGAGSVMAGFLTLVICYLSGVHYLLSIGIGVGTGSTCVYLTLFMNSRFGKNGVTKLLARKARKEYLKP